MAKSELIKSISTLSGRINTLLEYQARLKARVVELELRNNELEATHVIDTKELLKAKKEIEFLSLSHRLASSPEALVSARKEISKLIRTIDSCIRIIKED